jgi:O-succinylbenzoic acid--CoA ligase
LLAQATEAKLPLSLGYGMTETAAMVCASRPEEFLAGRVECGRALPHVRLEIVDTETGGAVAAGATGLVRIEAASLFRGYFGRAEEAGSFLSEDVGSLDGAGRLTIHGRRDGVIISGGKKIFAAEVETQLRATGVFSDVAVVGCADAQWGQRVVACYPASDGVIAAERLTGALAQLAAYQRPKEFLPVAHWPRNELGKLNRRALVARVQGSRETRVESRESGLRSDQPASRE